MTGVAVTGDGYFTSDKLSEALAAVCARAGLDPTSAQLLRMTNNAVYRLARHPVVVRIVASRGLRHRVEKVVQVARWFADNEVPAVRLWSGVAQPVRTGGHIATLWDTVDERGTARPHDLARLLRQVHELPAPPFPLPTWQPLDDVRRRVAEAEGLDEEVRTFLRRQCDEVEGRVGELDFALPAALIHGDAHLGNLIPSAAGPVLCDFDSSCIGPPEWDLTPLAVGVIRFGEPAGRYRELAGTYGFDVTRWTGFAVLREVRELKLITSVLPIMSSNPGVRPELLRRLDDFRHGNSSARWSRYT